MNSAAPASKKPALCRYFATNGTCYYGTECQFLHEAPSGSVPRPPGKSPLVFQQPDHNVMEGVHPRENSDGANGDQFFSATFAGASEIPDFQQFNRGKGVRVSGPLGDGVPGKGPFFPPGPHSSTSSLDDSVLTDQFAALAVSSHPHNKLQGALKGKNIAASEFVPKASTPTHNSLSMAQNTMGLSHSASSPSFQSYSAMAGGHNNSSGMIGNSTPNSLSHGAPFSTGMSPMASPHLSPQGSPIGSRRNKSPGPLTNPGASTPTSGIGNLQVSHTESFGGTTYFYRQEDMTPTHQGVILPNFTMYPGILPHVAHMKPKSNQPSFFMADELKLELLNRHAVSMAQIDPEANPDIPAEVDNYHSLFPLEPPPINPMQKSCTFGYHTTVYKAVCTKDGLSYCLRRIHGFRLVNTKCMAIIDLWKKIQHSNIIQLREVFTTKAFGDHSMVFVYDYHPGAETLMARHFSTPNHTHLNGYNNPYNLDGAARPYSAGKGGGPRQHANLLSESMIWSYIVQLSSALRTIHAHGLACRVMDPTKVLLTDKSRVRLNCVGIFDVLSFDANQSNPLAMMPHYQEDLISLGRVVLALACNSIIGIQREHIQTSLELVTRNYSADLKNLILYLLTNQNRPRSVNDIMPMIGARFYTQLDAALLKNDCLENELSKEVENGRLLRLTSKLGIINERPEFSMDPAWSETGDRYMLKLFRDYLYHQVDENGAPWVDMAHIVQNLNKLDAGVPEKICLMSRDEQNVLVVSYADLKQCCESAFTELINAGRQSQQQHFS